ncbi:MAG: IS200/IS605 family transposase [Planctomycetota bacterium]
MATFTQIVYHVVFAAKDRRPVFHKENREELFRYLTGVLKRRQSLLFVINGVEDHLHILTTLHPSVALADLVKDLKVSSSGWIKRKQLFPGFKGWQDGFAAFTCSARERKNVIRYIENQEEHHRRRTFREEFVAMLKLAGVEYDDRYLP